MIGEAKHLGGGPGADTETVDLCFIVLRSSYRMSPGIRMGCERG